jgi:hypothetical protein
MGFAVACISIILIGGIYFFLWKNEAGNVAERLIVWIIFSVIVALTPIIFNAILTFITGSTPTLSQLLKNGELLIIAVAVGADAVGKLVGSGTSKKIYKILSAGVCILLIIVSSLLFSAISMTSIGASFDPLRVAHVSIYVYLLTMITSGSCIILAEVG